MNRTWPSGDTTGGSDAARATRVIAAVADGDPGIVAIGIQASKASVSTVTCESDRTHEIHAT